MAKVAIGREHRQLLEMVDMWESLARGLDARTAGAPVQPPEVKAEKLGG